VTTQPHLPDPSLDPARPLLRLAPEPVPADDAAFEAFVRSYESRLRRLVLRRIGDLCEAEEITQETLLRAYQHRASFTTEDELMAWSTVVAQRLVIDRVRVRGRSVAVPDVPETARLGRDTADVVVARHEARAALESLEAIPTRQAAILWAREVEGLHYEEIADRFGITEPAVRSLLHRGRKALRKEFKDRTGSLPLSGLAPFAPWLLALKAAGKVRGVAKTAAKAPATAVAALSLTALIAVSIGGVLDATAPEGRAVAIAPGRGGATYVSSFEAPDAVQRESALRRTSFRPVSAKHGSAPTATTWHVDVRIKARPRNPSVCLDPAPNCIVNGDGYFSGAVIQVGGDLPENPLDAENIKVSQDQVGCDTLNLPENDAVTCTQHGPSDGSTIPASDIQTIPRKPSTAEGATR
jgi:RNA polymerase sigma-70 factor (ECF subfamily)